MFAIEFLCLSGALFVSFLVVTIAYCFDKSSSTKQQQQINSIARSLRGINYHLKKTAQCNEAMYQLVVGAVATVNLYPGEAPQQEEEEEEEEPLSRSSLREEWVVDREGGGNNPYVKDLYYDDNGLCNNCHQGELIERYSAKYFNYNYQCQSCKCYGGIHDQPETNIQEAAHAIPETTPPNSQRGFKRPLPETQAPEEEEEDTNELILRLYEEANNNLAEIAQELFAQMKHMRDRQDDLHSMISALSPTQEVKKEDYERLVARSTKEAESLKKASDSLPTTTKRAKKEESS